jgi:hypothetical protein
VDIFVPGRGQYENIGDVLLRRHLLDWLRPCGRLHVYVGRSPLGYDQGLGLQPQDVAYRSFLRWYRAGLASAARGHASYVFKPGEIQLTLVGMKEHLSVLPLVALIRARGGSVARVGAGSRDVPARSGPARLPGPAGLPRMLIRPSIALSNLSLWRETETARCLGGGVVPDLGFGEGTPVHAALTDSGRGSAALTAAAFSGRDVLVVSMRSDLGVRPYPSSEWYDAIRLVAERYGLEIWTATQVQVDDERSRRLASVLGAHVLGWDGLGHDQQEARLRALYRRAVVVVSDRLHVLVAALTEGAVPAGLVLDSSGKIALHFAAAGMHDVSFPSAGLGTAELVARIENLLGRRDMLLEQLELARGELETAGQRLSRVLGAASDTKASADRNESAIGAVFAPETPIGAVFAQGGPGS